MDKYEYLTGEDLGLKPSTAEQVKFAKSLFMHSDFSSIKVKVLLMYSFNSP